MRRLTFLCFLLFAGFSPAQQIAVPAVVDLAVGETKDITADSNCDAISWVMVGKGTMLVDYGKHGGNFKDISLLGVTEGKMSKLVCVGSKLVDGKVKQCVFVITVVVGTPTPEPTPGPPVPPVPPAPVPDPAPIADAGFRVMLLYESANMALLPTAQANVMFSTSLRTYLNSKCVKGPDGKTAEWRIWDSGVDASNESDLWQKALKLGTTAAQQASPPRFPWLIISDGKTGYVGPLPANLDATMTLLKKFGGS